MKKHFLVGYLSVAALALNGPAAQAGLLHHCCGCHKCCTYLCVRPYNAFSPVCCGSVSCIGCCPMFGGMGGGMDCGPCGPVGGGMPSCFNGCCPSYSSSG